MPWSTKDPESPFDHFTFAVEGARVGKYAKYMDGKVVGLILTGTKVFDEIIKTPEGPITEQANEDVFISVGENWTTDDGATLYSTEGKTEFGSFSKIGRMINLVVESGQADEMVGEPEEAKTWIGTRWRFGSWKAKVRGEDTMIRGPVEFLGFVGAEKTAEKAVTAVDDATTPESAASNPRKAIVALAKALKAAGKDHSEFVAKATDIPGVSDDAALLGEIIDETGELWSQA